MDDIITLAMSEFGPFVNTNVHLNHAGLAPWPQRTQRAIVEFTQQNTASSPPNYAQWIATTNRLRHNLAQLINAKNADEIALIKNTSEGLSIIGYGINWQPNDNIVIGQQEFPSNRLLWEDISQRFNVELRCVDLYSADEPHLALCNAVDANTRLLSVSSVQYAYGNRVNLKALGIACRDNDTLFCVDAIQSLGALAIDVQVIDADFIIADAHKWLLAPEGIGVLYCRNERIKSLTLHQIGWASLENYGNYDALFYSSKLGDWQLATSARRFEPGSLNNLGIQGLDKSVELLLEVGIENIERAIGERIAFLFNHIDTNQYQILTPPHSNQQAGIFTFKHQDEQFNQKLFAQLKERNVICALRGGGIRLSPHFYTPIEQLDDVMQYINAFKL